MADRYVYSGASGSGTGADWANAYTTLAAAFSGGAAGDRFFVAHDHAETQSSPMSLTCPGTDSSPCLILCVDRGGSVPPVSADLRTTATITTTGANAIEYAPIANKQNFYEYGITYRAGSGAVSSKLILSNGGNTAVHERCNFQKLGTAGSSTAITLNASGEGGSLNHRFIDCTLKFGSSDDAVSALFQSKTVFQGNAGGPLVDAAGAIPTILFRVSAHHLLDGVDLSTMGASYIHGQSNGGRLIMRNCKLVSSAAVTSGFSAGTHSRVEAYNCDSADTNYRLWVEDYCGSIKDETTLVKTGGASDGDTPLSWKMASSANAEYPLHILRSPEIFSERITSVGGAKTITVDILRDSATNLKDDEIWIEVQYLGTSGFPLSLFADDAKADVLATAADQAASSATWTTTGMTNPNKQKLEVTFTPQEKGVAIVTVCMAKASATVYVDPVAQVT